MKNFKLPVFPLKVINKNNGRQVFDIVRRKYVAFTPEEFIRQTFIHYLVHEMGYKISLLAVEYFLKLNQVFKRCDIVAFKNRKPLVIVECKAPGVPISEQTAIQLQQYNMSLQVNYLILTNGNITYCYRVDYENNKVNEMLEIPFFDEL